MAALSVELSPAPSSNTPYQALEPHECRQSSPIARTVKRKSGMSVTTPLRKRIRFDIEPTCQDANMDSYQARINRAIGYPRPTRVILPTARCKIRSRSLTMLISNSLKTIEQLKIQMQEQDTRIQTLEQMNHQRLSLMRANITNGFCQENMP